MKAVQDRAVPEYRRDDERVELVEIRDGFGVHTRQERVGSGDAECKPFVKELVGHHEPIRNAARDQGEREAEAQPEAGERKQRSQASPHRLDGSRRGGRLYNALKEPRYGAAVRPPRGVSRRRMSL